jgi:hypothetical protein
MPAFGPRMVCTGCGMIGADARPNWRERYDPGPITRDHARPLTALLNSVGHNQKTVPRRRPRGTKRRISGPRHRSPSTFVRRACQRVPRG